MALPSTKVEIAFNAGFTTASGSRTWTDVSTYVEASSAINITRGRTDQGQVPPGQLTLTLNNRDGRFTPEKTAGAYYPNVKLGRPIRITVTYNAVNYVRFLGFIDAWTPGWPDGTDAIAVTTVHAASRLARLGRGAEMASLVTTEFLADTPLAYYTLGEASGATSAADSSGNQASPLTLTGSGTAPTFGADIPIAGGGQSGVEFAGGKYLTVSPPTAAAQQVEFFFSTTTNDATARSLLEVNASGGFGPQLYASLQNGHLYLYTIDAGFVADGAVHHVMMQGTIPYLDGNIVTTGAAQFFSSMNVGGGTLGAGFIGTIAHLATDSALISAARITAHAQAGLTGLAELSGARISRYATYAGVPVGETAIDTGLATIGAVDTTGQAPVDLMRRVERTENGNLYDAKDGTLTFKDRDFRYNATAAFTLSATSQEIESDLNPDYDDTYVLNYVSAVANGVAAGTAFDQTYIDDLGYYRDTFDSVTDNTTDALNGAQWLVGTRKDPRTRYSPVGVDIVNSSTSQAAAVLGAEIGTRFDLSGLPSQAAATTAELFAEGYSEVITSATHDIKFNTSPVFGYAGSGTSGVWQLQVAGRSELGDTTRLGY